MADILERLHLAVTDKTSSSTALYLDAVNEIEELRGKNKELQSKLEQYYRMGEAEC